MDLLGAFHGWGWGKKAPSLKSVKHPTMIKLGTVIPHPKKIQKIYESRDIPLEFCWHQYFFTGNQQVLLYQEMKYRLHFDTWFLILLIFFESLKIILVKMVTILMMLAKMATLGLLKIKLFWNKGYDVIIFIPDVTNKISSRDSNYIVGVVMWLKFGNFSIFIREFIITSIL